MTADPQAHPGGLLTLLFGAAGNLPEALAAAGLPAAIETNLGAVVAGLPHDLAAAAVTEVTTAVPRLLDVNLADLLVAGWREHADLTAAARRTAADPGSTELLSLTTHQLDGSLEPWVTLLVDHRPVAKVQLGLSVSCEISALLAQVSAGRLTGIRTGRCDLTATLTVQDVDVASRARRIDLPGLLTLTPGIRLLRASACQPADDRTQLLGASGRLGAGDGRPAGPLSRWPGRRASG